MPPTQATIHAITSMIEASRSTPARNAVCALAEIALSNISSLDHEAASMLALAARAAQLPHPVLLDQAAPGHSCLPNQFDTKKGRSADVPSALGHMLVSPFPVVQEWARG